MSSKQTELSPVDSENPGKKRRKRILGYILKVSISGLALWFVFKKVDFESIGTRLATANLLFVLLALVSFNLSKILATLRVKAFLSNLKVKVSHSYNIRLYYIGAFYNLFLPGSVGGDGYKVWLLKKKFETPTRKLISTVLLDRPSGLAALTFLAGFLVLGTGFDPGWAGFKIMIISIMVLIFPIFYLVILRFFKDYLSKFMFANGVSFASQGLQLLCAFCLLYALGISENIIDYLTLFMVSAVVSVIPLTLGGLGSREYVFFVGPQFLPVSAELGVAFSLLFFFVTAFSSVVGLILTFTKED